MASSEMAITAATIFLALFFLPSPSPVTSNPIQDVDALVAFASRIPHRRSLNWSLLTPVCQSWIGVTCSSDGSRVISLDLPSFDFHGEIPPGTLGRLSALETLSLPSNSLAGSIPSDLLNLTSLVEVHLQSNRFSGPLPANFFASNSNLAVLDLSFNSFNGSIPPSISNLANLVSLNLSCNSLDGEIPDLKIAGLRFLNLSNNRLEGRIPSSLKGFPSSSFEGNPIYSTSSLSIPRGGGGGGGNGGLGRKMSEPVLLGIVIGGCAVGLMLVMVLVVFLRKGGKEVGSGKVAKWERSPKKTEISKEQRNHLVFFEGCSFAFDLEDLLRASAEVLGKGMFGTAYKAIMEDSVAVVVKRLKDVSVGKREFEQQMEMVGRLRHENLVELRAYYYSKDEKLMVYDYCSQGSVFSMLHGKRGERREPLSWEGRLKIAIGAARGIAYIHAENGGKLVHGNIKSTNIFLNSSLYGCVSDLGVTTLVNLRFLQFLGLLDTELQKLLMVAKPLRCQMCIASVSSFSSS